MYSLLEVQIRSQLCCWTTTTHRTEVARVGYDLIPVLRGKYAIFYLVRTYRKLSATVPNLTLHTESNLRSGVLFFRGGKENLKQLLDY